MRAAAVIDYREMARRRVPRFVFDYVDGGSYGETTLRHNVLDLQSISLRQRILRDVSKIDLSTQWFGTSVTLPIALAPIGLAGLNARRGEVQAARAAEKAGVPFCLSTVSVSTLSEIKDSVSKPFWFQLYMMRDRAFMNSLLAEAERMQCSALVFTVDMPVPGSRYRDVRSGLAGAPGLGGAARRLGQALCRPRWAWDVGICGRPLTLGNIAPVLKGRTGIEDFFAWMRDNFDPTVTWEDLEWVRNHWKGPLILKGILDVEDARRAAELGVEGIVVSNHGGRQLDGTPSTARALPAIAEAVGDRVTIFADGGVRSGLDVIRMLALGAKGVLLGRAWVYALAAGGEAAVTHVLTLMQAEMRVALSLSGCTRVRDIDREILVQEDLGRASSGNCRIDDITRASLAAYSP
jgi:L-lactate dehydrogenase (cytochrome)